MLYLYTPNICHFYFVAIFSFLQCEINYILSIQGWWSHEYHQARFVCPPFFWAEWFPSPLPFIAIGGAGQNPIVIVVPGPRGLYRVSKWYLVWGVSAGEIKQFPTPLYPLVYILPSPPRLSSIYRPGPELHGSRPIIILLLAATLMRAGGRVNGRTHISQHPAVTALPCLSRASFHRSQWRSGPVPS